MGSEMTRQRAACLLLTSERLTKIDGQRIALAKTTINVSVNAVIADAAAGGEKAGEGGQMFSVDVC